MSGVAGLALMASVADGLTEDISVAADVLRGALRAGSFEKAEEGAMLEAAKKARDLRLARKLKDKDSQYEAAVQKRVRQLGEMLGLLERDSWADQKMEKKIKGLLPELKVQAVRMMAQPKKEFRPESPSSGRAPRC